MGKYKRLSSAERMEIIQPFMEGRCSINQIAKESGIDHTVLRDWIRKFKQDGIQGLENGKGWKQYSSELKKNAVEDVLLNNLSKHEVVRKYGISSRSVLRRWIKSYNSGKELEETSTGRSGAIMTKGRKTTFEERIEITEYTIARNFDYQGAQEKYDVSYSQVYSWVKKYEKLGQEGLKDNRGRGKDKPEEELSEVGKLKLEIKRLKERNEFLEIQDAFGKKLKELEHRYGPFR
jgi:transposase